MPSYQKVYLLGQVRKFPGWSEDRLRDVFGRMRARGDALATEPEPTDDTPVFLHEDLKVTLSCFEDDEGVFESDSASWSTFCREELGFCVPDWEAESKQVREAIARAET